MAVQVRRPQQFTVQDLTISNDSPRMQYRKRSNNNKTSIHWGQRKLHMSEVEFFTLYWDPKSVPNPICVYAGAAPGTHIGLLSQMFPTFTFHLYDPSTFIITETDKIKIYKQYFTDDVAAQYANRNDIFFVSDIRTADYKRIQNEVLEKKGITNFGADGSPIGPADLIRDSLKEAGLQNEDQIWGDMNMQQDWITVMNPEHAFLKFRLPYVIDGNDRIVQYLKGVVYWQPWAPQTSTETRLKPIRNAKGVYELANWSILEYEQWCFHHNAFDREQTLYQNIFNGMNEPIDYPELLNDYDSVAEAFILRLYFEKMGITDPTLLYQRVKSLSRLTTWSINHQRTDDKGAKSLAAKRSSPVKSSSKYALDAFRVKRGKQVNPGTQFEHTNIVVNPEWRQQVIVPARSPAATFTNHQPRRSQATPGIITGTVRSPNVPAYPPKRSPTTPTIVTGQVRSPNVPAITPLNVPGAVTSPTLPAITPLNVPTVVRSPTIPAITPLNVPAVVRSPTIPGVRSPTVPPITPLNVPAVVRSPTMPAITPVTIPGVRSPTMPAITPVIVPGVRSPNLPGITPLNVPGVARSPTIPAITPVTIPGVRSPNLPGITPLNVPAVVRSATIPAIAPITVPGVRSPNLPGITPLNVPGRSPIGPTITPLNVATPTRSTTVPGITPLNVPTGTRSPIVPVAKPFTVAKPVVNVITPTRSPVATPVVVARPVLQQKPTVISPKF